MFYRPNVTLGVGLNYRSEISHDIISNLNHIDFIEINTERFFHNKSNSYLDKIINALPVVLHGLSLSQQSFSIINKIYLNSPTLLIKLIAVQNIYNFDKKYAKKCFDKLEKFL